MICLGCAKSREMTKEIENYSIHWFRRDLRIAGNKALKWNHKKFDGRVLGLFCFDKDFLDREDFSHNRFQFFLETLKSLKKELNLIGGDLLLIDEPPLKAFKKIFNILEKNQISLPQTITWNRDYEPFARKRDQEIKDFLNDEDIEFETFRDHLVIEPHELTKSDSQTEGYQVYSPFARKWLELFQQDDFSKRVKEQKNGFSYLKKIISNQSTKILNLKWNHVLQPDQLKDSLDDYIESNSKKVDVPIPETGSAAVYKQLEQFKSKINSYKDDRDLPYVEGTSRFSLFLKNGSLTISQVIHFFDLQPYKKAKSSKEKFLSELIWREFYYHILYRHPEVETESFLEKYKNLKWENNKDWFEAWKNGQTGFPIVDAGMRELNQTGWMHNRVRMIVASFLTKDLLIDWRWGEKYFMDKLLDGDLAPNNGGWQWAASTGCDPQPYFRIFNPWLQSKKFDPDGEYIKTYIPELKDLESKKLHSPIEGQKDYPAPIVDHKEQREKALKLYKLEGS